MQTTRGLLVGISAVVAVGSFLVPSVHAITINGAKIARGVIQVRGKQASATDATITWEGEPVAQATSTGKFRFDTTVLPEDCVGQVGDGIETVEAVIQFCGPVGPPGEQGPQGAPGIGLLIQCPSDAVKVGPTCVDKYEASVWSIPLGNVGLRDKVQEGEASLEDLIQGGATQHGCPGAPFSHTAFPGSFPRTGNWTEPLYAVSVAGVLPTTCVHWFQAAQACALAGKRLLTNEEWQRAAAGTPDPGTDNGTTDCNVASATPVSTGSRSACSSVWGTFDMVGNVEEWVGDWGDAATGCTSWPTELGSDLACVGGDGSFNLPGAPARGGNWDTLNGLFSGPSAGVFALNVGADPSRESVGIGFRCGR